MITGVFIFYGGPSKHLTQNYFLSLEIFEILELKSRPKYLDGTFLSDLYLKKGLSLRQISNKLKVSRNVVRKHLEVISLIKRSPLIKN